MNVDTLSDLVAPLAKYVPADLAARVQETTAKAVDLLDDVDTFLIDLKWAAQKENVSGDDTWANKVDDVKQEPAPAPSQTGGSEDLLSILSSMYDYLVVNNLHVGQVWEHMNKDRVLANYKVSLSSRFYNAVTTRMV